MFNLSKVQLLSVSTLFALAIAVLFGPVYMMGMEANENGQMGGCIFTGKDVCIMSISEHLHAWAGLFSFISNEIIRTVLVVLFLLLPHFFVKSEKILPSRDRLYSRFYIRSWPNIFSLTPLRQAFATGILNPKIF